MIFSKEYKINSLDVVDKLLHDIGYQLYEERKEEITVKLLETAFSVGASRSRPSY